MLERSLYFCKRGSQPTIDHAHFSVLIIYFGKFAWKIKRNEKSNSLNLYSNLKLSMPCYYLHASKEFCELFQLNLWRDFWNFWVFVRFHWFQSNILHCFLHFFFLLYRPQKLFQVYISSTQSTCYNCFELCLWINNRETKICNVIPYLIRTRIHWDQCHRIDNAHAT